MIVTGNLLYLGEPTVDGRRIDSVIVNTLVDAPVRAIRRDGPIPALGTSMVASLVDVIVTAGGAVRVRMEITPDVWETLTGCGRGGVRMTFDLGNSDKSRTGGTEEQPIVVFNEATIACIWLSPARLYSDRISGDDCLWPTGDSLLLPEPEVPSDLSICEENPDGRHGPLAPAMMGGKAHVVCEACGASTELPIPAADDVEWN